MTQQYIEVMQAYVRGEPVEHKYAHGGEWKPLESAMWDFRNYDYRVSPNAEATAETVQP